MPDSSRLCLLVFLMACAAAAQTAPTASNGLDSLSDDALMNELASRGMDTLLTRAFEVNKVPKSEQDARRTLISLARLSDPNARFAPGERQRLTSDVVRGIEPALPGINDPQLLMRQASVLITAGIERDVNTLEYWGENARTQDHLRPVIETVVKILERCQTLARQQADDLANRITQPQSPMTAKYEEMERLAATAEYTKNMVYYYLALSLDRSSARRRQIAQAAYDYLRQFDVEENPDRNLLRTRLAKLMMVKGDYEQARRIFDHVTDGPTAETKVVAIQYEARYFAAITEVLAKNSATAKQHLRDVLAWQEANLPKQDKAARDGAEAAAAMLEYRIKALDAELAPDARSRKEADDAAVLVLMNLLGRRPDLRGVIYEQLIPRLDQNQPLGGVDPLLLRALVAKGEEQLRVSDTLVETRLLERAVAAAREVVARGKRNAIDPQLAESSALLEGFFLDKLDRHAEAAEAFLNYVEAYKTARLQNAILALDNAQAIIGRLRQTQRDDAAVVALYERFLPMAIAAPFNRMQFAFEWARRLQLNGKHAEAIEFYRMVPATDRRALDARYFELVAQKQRLEGDPSIQAHAILAEIQRLADEVNRSAADALARAADERHKESYRLMLARTSLLAADLARREQNDPARALRVLERFEDSTKDLPNAAPLLTDAMFIRVQALMAQQRYSDATQQLVQLLQQSQGAAGAQIVYNLLQKLNQDFDRAQAAGDREQMRTLARNRAQLSGFLVQWAAGNADPGIKRFTYRYKVFDADTHRRAADLDPDPSSRRAGLETARDKFKALETPENVALYRQSIDAAQIDPDAPDPQVDLGLALIEYDLSNWKEAAGRFSSLLTSRRIGNPVNVVEEDGEQKSVDNELYWEAVLKLIRCNMQLGTGIEESKQFLKQQYITWGDRVGGKKWKPEYEKLRQEIIPEFQIDQSAVPTTSP